MSPTSTTKAAPPPAPPNAQTLPEATPTDSPEPPKPKRRRNVKKSSHYKLFDDGEGDYRIYEIAQKDSGMPQGALLPIAGVPGFSESKYAMKFINNSGNLLEGKQVMVLKGLEICSVNVVTKTAVTVNLKPKRLVSPTAKDAGEDGQ